MANMQGGRNANLIPIVALATTAVVGAGWLVNNEIDHRTEAGQNIAVAEAAERLACVAIENYNEDQTGWRVDSDSEIGVTYLEFSSGDEEKELTSIVGLRLYDNPRGTLECGWVDSIQIYQFVGTSNEPTADYSITMFEPNNEWSALIDTDWSNRVTQSSECYAGCGGYTMSKEEFEAAVDQAETTLSDIFS